MGANRGFAPVTDESIALLNETAADLCVQGLNAAAKSGRDRDNATGPGLTGFARERSRAGAA